MRALPSAGHSSRVPGWRQDWEQNVQKNSLICFESIPLVGPQFSQPGREGMGCVCWGSPPPLRGPHCPPAMVWGIRGLLGSEQSPPNPQPPEGAKLGQNRGSEAPPPGPPPLCVDPAGPGRLLPWAFASAAPRLGTVLCPADGAPRRGPLRGHDLPLLRVHRPPTLGSAKGLSCVPKAAEDRGAFRSLCW